MMKYKTPTILVTGIIAALIMIAGSSLFVQGPLGEYLMKPESGQMLAELLICSLWNFLWLSRDKVWHRCAGVLASFVVFLWLHQLLVPVLVSGIYLALIAALGYGSRKLVHAKGGDESAAAAVLIDFMTGYAVWVVLVCLLSALKLGAIRNLRLLVLAWGIVVLLWCMIRHKWLAEEIRAIKLPHVSSSLRTAAAMTGFAAVWMIQAGRANIALDYDSLHYGLRSAFILDNGTGIYENLGNINLVYTYSKGFEILGLPLAGTATYGFILAINLWITLLVLGALGLSANEAFGKRTAGLAMLLAAAVPALMNMSITAKSDNLTLLFQLLCLYGCILCLKRKEQADYLLAVMAYILTLTLKPTAIVFSTLLFGSSSLYLLKRERSAFWRRLFGAGNWWFLLLAAVGAWIGTWARTWKLTGVPITSIFTGIFERLGFRVKAPFAFMSVPSNGTTLSFPEAARYLGTRLYRVLLVPVGEDMAHVNIAWGGGIIVFLLLVCLVFLVKGKGRRRAMMRYLTLLLLVIGLMSLVSLYLLWQVDGNYYQLFYVLVILLTSGFLEPGMELVNKQNQWTFWRRAVRICLIPLFAFQLLVMALTNWAGTSGFTPVKWNHKGWYNHMEANVRQMSETGNAGIWNRLAADPAARVIAFGEHPQVLCFPCNVQSYYDVTGSGGNVWLVKKLDYFKAFLRYAGTQYIYVQDGYLEEGSRAEEIIRFMIEDGSLQDLLYENGNLLGRVVLDSEDYMEMEGDDNGTSYRSGIVESEKK